MSSTERSLPEEDWMPVGAQQPVLSKRTDIYQCPCFLAVRGQQPINTLFGLFGFSGYYSNSGPHYYYEVSDETHRIVFSFNLHSDSPAAKF